jgi:UDP-N-acetylglucosamine diphosphorylase/glucosamine-1-phosphate N-acetyltransferase
VTVLVVLEPAAPGAEWAPFAGVRPVSELRAGAWLVRERWERALGLRASAIHGTHAAGFHELDAPAVSVPTVIRGPAVIASAGFAPAAGRLALEPGSRLVHAGRTVALHLAAGAEASAADAFAGQGPGAEVEGAPLGGAYTLLDALEALLAADCEEGAAGGGDALPDGTIVLGPRERVAVRGGVIEPGVVFDVRHGSVVLERGAEVRSGTRIEGPCWIGPGSRIVGGFIRGSAIGPACVVRGEVSASVFLGYANKAHDGFVGHSVIGQWANLGAGTTTSNLKNTYGPVRLDVAGERIETGRTFLGSLVGDHAKTAIGTMLSTGTVVGAGANVLGGAPVPRYIAPFTWGAGGERMTEAGFLRIAGRVMPRRGIELTAERSASLAATWRRAVP